VDISHLPETTLHRLGRRSRIEERMSKTLEEIQESYKITNRTVQLALDTYPNALASATYIVGSDLKKSTDALHHLERKTATFRKKINNLLRTVHLSATEAWSYLVSFPRIDI
jgi:hypothetical protein